MFELVLLVGAEHADELSQRLLDQLTAASVSVEDADAGGADEHALYGEPGQPAPGAAWPRTRLAALFDDEAGASAAAAWSLARMPGVRVLDLRRVDEQDWVRLTQAQFAPVAITPRFWIVPSWHAVPDAAEQVIRLDPGQAFGTGTHPTTQMCLRWIAAHAPRRAAQWQRVLDYGCGSGVLAIAAARFGARAVCAVDIDPAAVAATRANADANSVTIEAGEPSMACGLYDLVLANILATPLTVLAPLLSAHLAPGADLVLAGILERQAGTLRRAYAPLALEVVDRQEGWILMTARRAA